VCGQLFSQRLYRRDHCRPLTDTRNYARITHLVVKPGLKLGLSRNPVVPKAAAAQRGTRRSLKHPAAAAAAVPA
jgi:hypothetical protein